MKDILRKNDFNFLINMLFSYNEHIFDFELNEIENNLIISFNNTIKQTIMKIKLKYNYF